MIFEKIHEPENLETAWKRVRAANPRPGIDRVSHQDFEKNLSANLHQLRDQLRNESYAPLPVVVFDKEKTRGRRPIGISTVRDRVVQQAVLQVVGPLFESHFLPCSYAYRPKRSALDAVSRAARLVRDGRHWCLRMDVAAFFDSLDHLLLTDLLRRFVDEKPFVRLISRLLKAKIFKQMGLFDHTVGSQQGSGLSPLLSNIYLLPMDHFLWKRYGEAYLRYSDDIALFAAEKEPLESARELVEKCLAELRLSANSDKTELTHAADGLVYLGYHIDARGKGPARKSVEQLEERLRKFDKLRRTDAIDGRLKEATAIVRGWRQYYHTLKPIQPPNVLSLLAVAELARENGETAAARDLLRKSDDFPVRHPDVAFRLGSLFEGLGMENQAVRTYARALEMAPDMEAAKARVRALQEGDEETLHGTIEKVQLVLHHNPDYREGYEKLADCYARLGLYGFAEKAHRKALEIDPEPADGPPTPVSPPEPEDAADFDPKAIDADLFLSVFSGRSDAHAKQWVDERGKWGFLRVERPLKKKDVIRHLRGEETLAVYPVHADDRVNFIVFDVDTANRKMMSLDSEAIPAFRARAHDDILRIKAACRSLNLALVLEDSGYKGRHGWLFFSEPVAASGALKLGRRIMEEAGGPGPDMVWELFPMGKSDRHRSIIKLPLGVNRKNQRRCRFLRDDGAPAPDQGLLLKTLQRNDVSELVKEQRPDPGGEGKGAEESVPPELRPMVQSCKVIGHLVDKARDTHYLTHFERMALLYTLTFAGEPGKAFLHTVMAYCVNYSRGVTQGYIDRRKESPISCARIAEYFPELPQSLGCDCRFDLPPRGYPSPVLYLLESEIEKAYPPVPAGEPATENAAAEKTGAGAESPRPGEEGALLDFSALFADEVGEEAEGGERSELADLPEAAKETEIPEETASSRVPEASLPGPARPAEDVAVGVLPGRAKAISPPAKVPAAEAHGKNPLETRPSAALETGGNSDEEACGDGLWDAAEELIRLRGARERIDRRLAAAEARLEAGFRGRESVVFRTPRGAIRRETDAKGNPRYILEV